MHSARNGRYAVELYIATRTPALAAADCDRARRCPDQDNGQLKVTAWPTEARRIISASPAVID